MATGITIKRYNGSTWDELAPKTTIAQVDDLQNQLNAKQTTDNLTTSWGSSLSDTKYPSEKLVKETIDDAKQYAVNLAEGKVKAYETYAYSSDIPNPMMSNDWTAYLYCSDTIPTINSELTYSTPDSSSKVINIKSASTFGSFSLEIIVPARYIYLLEYKSGGNGDPVKYYIRGYIDIATLNVGDILYVLNLDVPDLWVSKAYIDNYNNYVAYVSKLETTKVDLSEYSRSANTVSSITYDSTNQKLKKTIGGTVLLGGGTTTDVMNLGINDGTITIGGNSITPLTEHQSLNDYSTKANTVSNVSYSSGKIQETINDTTSDVLTVKIDNGVITIGSTSITPLTSHQTMYYRPISVAGTTQLANTSSSALNFVNTGNVTFTYDSGLKASVDLSSYAPKASPTFTGTVKMPFSSAGFVKTNSSGQLSVDTTSYTPTSRTINGLDLSTNRTLYAETVYANKTVIGSGTTAPSLATGRSYYEGDIWFVTAS